MRKQVRSQIRKSQSLLRCTLLTADAAAGNSIIDS
jgi:hypothetical protein